MVNSSLDIGGVLLFTPTVLIFSHVMILNQIGFRTICFHPVHSYCIHVPWISIVCCAILNQSFGAYSTTQYFKQNSTFYPLHCILNPTSNEAIVLNENYLSKLNPICIQCYIHIG